MTAFACHRGPWPGLFLAFACTVFAGASNTAFATDPMPVSARRRDGRSSRSGENRQTAGTHGDAGCRESADRRRGRAAWWRRRHHCQKLTGATNLVALDRNGATLSDHSILVVGPADKVVVVYRGIDRETYSCVPNCERRITIGDTAGYFTANLGQLGAFGSQVQGGGAAPAK